MRMKCLSQELNAMTSVRARTQIAWSSSMLKGTVLLSEFRKGGGRGEGVQFPSPLYSFLLYVFSFSSDEHRDWRERKIKFVV